jgi:hypothetical protein
MDARGVSPATGVVLLVILVILLASVFAVGAVELAEMDGKRDIAGQLQDGRTGDSGYDYDTGRLIWARDSAPAANTTHVVNYPIATGSDTAGNSLNSIVIEYPDGTANAASVDDRDDVLLVGIDGDADGRVETDATDDVECCPPDDGVKLSDGGNTLTVELSGNYNLEAEDSLVVVYRHTTNPGAGDYTVTVGVNGDVSRDGSLDIG